MKNKPIFYVIISSILFGISPPIAKILVGDIHPVTLSGFLYLGAFAGLFLYYLGQRFFGSVVESISPSLDRDDLLWVLLIILLGGVLGPISLMFGLRMVSGFTASLLLNLEGLATAFVAYFLFKENAGRKVWLALIFMTVAGVLLSWEPTTGRFNFLGPLLVVFATICWGFENNFTREISNKDPIQIASIKGVSAGSVSIIIAFLLGFEIFVGKSVVFALLLGAFSYGISLVLYIRALRDLGSFRTGAFFSFSPFVGALLSIVGLGEWIGWVMLPSAVLMAVGVWMVVTERHSHIHIHGQIVHSHSHTHDDLHHNHEHEEEIKGKHTHEHTHERTEHEHQHKPDLHHRHEHED